MSFAFAQDKRIAGGLSEALELDPGLRRGDGDVLSGRLIGIARRLRSRSAMETLVESLVTLEAGIVGDFRGIARPGRSTRRQVTVLRAEDWATVQGELDADAPWTVRRANLLVCGLTLSHRAGDYLAIGPDVRLEITGECDPCRRMDEQQPGLTAALTPAWRGGYLARVIVAGRIAIDDEVKVEAT